MRYARLFLKVSMGLLALGAVMGIAHAEEAGGAGAYLREGLGARALGMGNAATTSDQDAAAAYWNPAGLSHLQGTGLASQTSLLGAERAWNFANYCQRFDLGRTPCAVGFSWIYFSGGGDLEARSDNRPDPKYTFADSQNDLFISAAIEIMEGLAIGGNVKFLLQQIDENHASGPGLDLSLWQSLSPAWQWGLVLQDLYSSLAWSQVYAERLPTQVRVGFSGTPWTPEWIVALDLSSEYDHPSHTFQNPGYHAGMEYMCLPDLFLRAGLDNGRWALGAGWRFAISPKANCRLDYAVAAEKLPGAGLSHLFSLVVDVLGTSRQEQP